MSQVISTYSLQLNNIGGGGFNSTSYSAATSWGFAGWINPYFDSTDSIYRLVAGEGDQSYGIYIFHGTVQLFSGGSFLVSSSVVPTQNAWNHIVVTGDGGNITIYINGNQDQSATSADMHFSAFGSSDNGTNNNFDGAFDDFRIYARNISALEVAALSSGQEISATSIYSYWKFDDGSGITATDSSGNGINAGLSGNETWLASPNVPTQLQPAPPPSSQKRSLIGVGI